MSRRLPNHCAPLFPPQPLSVGHTEKDTKRKEYVALRSACESAITALNAEIGASAPHAALTESQAAAPLPTPTSADSLVDADKFVIASVAESHAYPPMCRRRYFLPFRLACEAKSPKLVRTSLDCLQKLMAHGILRGALKVSEEAAGEHLIDVVIDVIWCGLQRANEILPRGVTHT